MACETMRFSYTDLHSSCVPYTFNTISFISQWHTRGIWNIRNRGGGVVSCDQTTGVFHLHH